MHESAAGTTNGSSGEGSSARTGYPDSAPNGVPAQSGGHQSGSHQSVGHQSGGYQSGGQQSGGTRAVAHQSGGFLNGGFQGGGFQAGQAQGAPAQAGPAQAGQAQVAPGQAAPTQAGPGQADPPQASTGQTGTGTSRTGAPPSAYQDGGPHDRYQGTPGAGWPSQTSTVHHLSGLSFPAAAAPQQNGHPSGSPAIVQLRTATRAVIKADQGRTDRRRTEREFTRRPVIRMAPRRTLLASTAHSAATSPASSNNGGQANPALGSGGPGNPAANGAPVNGNGAGGGRASLNPAGFEAAPVAGQSSLYGPIDPGFFPGQAGGGPQAQQAPSQPPGLGAHARDAYGQVQPGGPSFQPRAAHPAQPYQAQPQLPSQHSQPASPLPAVRAPQPVAVSLPEAVKAAHSEGYSFGESVGRDAPGLWLEAVLARKPRMPSDLEARLLQGSVLPIDSLLHDEVRHSLRRGFWDALESARR